MDSPSVESRSVGVRRIAGARAVSLAGQGERGSTTRTIHSERTIRAFAVHESEFDSISQASTQVTLFSSLATLCGSIVSAGVLTLVTFDDLTDKELLDMELVLIWFIIGLMVLFSIVFGVLRLPCT